MLEWGWPGDSGPCQTGRKTHSSLLKGKLWVGGKKKGGCLGLAQKKGDKGETCQRGVFEKGKRELTSRRFGVR